MGKGGRCPRSHIVSLAIQRERVRAKEERGTDLDASSDDDPEGLDVVAEAVKLELEVGRDWVGRRVELGGLLAEGLGGRAWPWIGRRRSVHRARAQ